MVLLILTAACAAPNSHPAYNASAAASEDWPAHVSTDGIISQIVLETLEKTQGKHQQKILSLAESKAELHKLQLDPIKAELESKVNAVLCDYNAMGSFNNGA